jgi:hypothetical protein
VPVADRRGEQLRRAVDVGGGAAGGTRGGDDLPDQPDHAGEARVERVEHGGVGVGLPPQQVGQQRRRVQRPVERVDEAVQAGRDVPRHDDRPQVDSVLGQPLDQCRQQIE